jgi:hypothetical protein
LHGDVRYFFLLTKAMMQHSKLNIPLRMIGGAMSNKKRLQLIALSIAIKCNYADSRMRNVSVKAIQDGSLV